MYFVFLILINFIIPRIRNVYETITESVTSLFGSIREIYSLLRHVIDDKDLDKAISFYKNLNALNKIEHKIIFPIYFFVFVYC